MHILIIGAGPGGYETAVAAASKGVEVTIVSDGPVGGTCLNEGCIPTKSFCRNAEIVDNFRNSAEFAMENVSWDFNFSKVLERKDAVVAQLRSGVEFLLKNKQIRLIYGKASFKSNTEVTVSHADGSPSEDISADYIIIATGSISASLPVPGADLPGVITSREILNIEEVPSELCVIGAGVIGLEFASVFNSFGSKVTVVEYFKDILPRFDTDMSKRLKQSLTRKGIEIETSASVQAIEQCEGGKLAVKYIKKDKECVVTADKVLMAVGRRPNVSSLNLEVTGVEFSPKGIVTDENMRTNVPNIYAIGDVRGKMMLAHVATFEGYRALGSILAGGGAPDDGINFGIIPAAVFTSPEAATVGKTEDECKAEGMKVKCLKSFYRANGKALSMAESDGYCKIVVEAETGRILGCHMFGAHSSDIVQEVAAIMNMNGTVTDFKQIIHAHPTLVEVLQSAVHSV